jgi:RNA polymerase sigma-70 factor (ECF subfamily)
MHNKFLDTMRFNQRWQWTDETEIDNYFESECNESKLIEQQTAECVCKAMASLPFEQREVIALVDLQGFSYQQVSDITATPVGTVMSRISRGRENLVKRMKQMEKANSNIVPLRR